MYNGFRALLYRLQTLIMKLTALQTSLVALVFFFASCSKNDSTEDIPKTDKIKTYTETIKSTFLGNYSTTYLLTYDQDGRLSKMSDQTIPTNKFEFTYKPGGFAFDIFTSGDVIIHEDVFVNGALIDSTIQYNDEGDTTSEKYVYNGNLLVKLNEYMHMSQGPVLDNVTTYTYNADESLNTETDGYYTITYSYAGEVWNTLNLFPVLHSPSRRLPSKETYTSGGEQIIIDHTYAFDTQKRLVSDHAVVSSGDEITKTFTYE